MAADLWVLILVGSLLGCIGYIAWTIKDSNTVKREPDADDTPDKPTPNK